LLGTNKSTDTEVKLFPRNSQPIVDEIQAKIKDLTGKVVEVMVYGDVALKDPVGQICELADLVVSHGHTEGLNGQPNEIKLKYLADNHFSDLRGDQLKSAISDFMEERKEDVNENDSVESQGTTPRKLTDLIGSLSDLTSGSGDKGTPIVYIQGYFDNFIA